MDTDNWRDIHWQPINALTGGSVQFPTGVGLKPWYLKDFKPPALPGQTSFPAPANSNASHTLPNPTFRIRLREKH